MEIPGYKWDRERKRYFKVLKTGELPNSSYTVSALTSKDRQARRKLVRQENEALRANDSVVKSQHVLKLGSRSRVCYSGGPTETISSFATTSSGLLTGARDGTLSLGQWKSEFGRSIVDICMLQERPAVAAVDHNAGTFVAFGAETTRLKGQFATRMLDIGGSTSATIGIGSQQGLTVWKPEVVAVDVLKVGSVSALSKSQGSGIVAGCRDGSIKLVDLRSRSSVARGSLGTGSMVTHVASLASRSAILATGLEDRMMLFDTRKTVEPIYQFQGYENWSTGAHGFALSPNNESAAVAVESGCVEVYDVFCGNLAKTLQQSNKTSGRPNKSASVVTCLRWTEDGLFMAVGSKIRAFPSVSRAETPGPAAAQLHELEIMHSNINLHEKT